MPRRIRREEEAFQMAPMIDMVFLLLVFFMTVSTLAKEARPELDLAYSDTATIPEAADARPILTVMPDGDGYQAFWYNRQIDPSELEELLQKNNGEAILVRAPADLPWNTVEKVLKPLRGSGVTEATFATFEK